MLTEMLLIAAVGIIDPMDMTGNEMYPSGFKEVDKYPKFAPPPSKNATLSLPKPIIASDGRIISAGHYLVSLSVSKNEILIFEGTKNLYTLKITELKTRDKVLKLSTAQFFTDNNGVSFIIIDDKQYHAIVMVELYDFAQ